MTIHERESVRGLVRQHLASTTARYTKGGTFRFYERAWVYRPPDHLENEHEHVYQEKHDGERRHPYIFGDGVSRKRENASIQGSLNSDEPKGREISKDATAV